MPRRWRHESVGGVLALRLAVRHPVQRPGPVGQLELVPAVCDTFLFSSYSKGLDERLKQLEMRQAESELLQKQIATSLAALPTAKDMHRLEVGLTGIDGAVKASQAEVRGLASGVNRIERVVDMLTESHIGGK